MVSDDDYYDKFSRNEVELKNERRKAFYLTNPVSVPLKDFFFQK